MYKMILNVCIKYFCVLFLTNFALTLQSKLLNTIQKMILNVALKYTKMILNVKDDFKCCIKYTVNFQTCILCDKIFRKSFISRNIYFVI